MTSNLPANFASIADVPDAVWAAIRSAARDGDELSIAVAKPWRDLFSPLCRPDLVIGQLGQSLDGRIATPAGHSHYINGPKAIIHLHRLRALVDAVVVGVGTAIADDPMLTVRHVEGKNPGPDRHRPDRAYTVTRQTVNAGWHPSLHPYEGEPPTGCGGRY